MEDITVKNGWIFAVRELAKIIKDMEPGGGDAATVDTLGGAGVTGKAVMKSATPAAARTAIDAALAGDVTTVQGDITSIQGSITAIQGSITSIESRLSALEGAG